jgi:acyl-CoA dehydrogenase
MWPTKIAVFRSILALGMTVIRDAETMNVLLDHISRLVSGRLIPNEGIVADTDESPTDIVTDMKAMGHFGMTIPEEYCGLGLTTQEEIFVVFELCHASLVFHSPRGTTIGIGSPGNLSDGAADRKERYILVS